MTRLLMVMILTAAVAGCSVVPQYEQEVYFYRGSPGPTEQAKRDAQRKALDADQALRVKLEAMKIHNHKLATNNTPPLPELPIPAHAKAQKMP